MRECERCGKDKKSYLGALCEDCYIEVHDPLPSSGAAFDMATRTRGQYRSVGANSNEQRVPLFRGGVGSNKWGY